jgi:hypothetical protein
MVNRGARAAVLGVLGATLLTAGAAWWDLPAPAPKPPAEPAERPERPVLIDILGKGDLFIDGKLVQKNVAEPQAAFLLPGPHVLELVGETRNVKNVEISADATISRFALDARARRTPGELLAERPVAAPAAKTRAIAINTKVRVDPVWMTSSTTVRTFPFASTGTSLPVTTGVPTATIRPPKRIGHVVATALPGTTTGRTSTTSWKSLTQPDARLTVGVALPFVRSRTRFFGTDHWSVPSQRAA